MKYEIYYRQTLRGKLTIEADSPEQAKDKIHDKYDNGFDLNDDPTHCTRSDDLEIESTTEVFL